MQPLLRNRCSAIRAVALLLQIWNLGLPETTYGNQSPEILITARVLELLGDTSGYVGLPDATSGNRTSQKPRATCGDNCREIWSHRKHRAARGYLKLPANTCDNRSPEKTSGLSGADWRDATWSYLWQPQCGKSGHAEVFEAIRSYLMLPVATCGNQTPESLVMQKTSRLSGATWCCLGLYICQSKKWKNQSRRKTSGLPDATWGYLWQPKSGKSGHVEILSQDQ